MPYPPTAQRNEADQLLREYLTHIQTASRPIDHHTTTPEDHRTAHERFQVHHAYLRDLIAAGLATGRILF